MSQVPTGRCLHAQTGAPALPRDQRRAAAGVPLREPTPTVLVAIEEERSRMNSASGLSSQGFAHRCELPR
ncbi:MAG: hypothetical protein ABIQ59_02350 [Nocardioidaceae bacterium]